MKLHINKFFPIFAIVILSLCSGNNVLSQFPSWGSISGGTNGTVNAVIEFNGDLIAAGSFTTPGRNIAKYNGTRWDTLSSGLNDTVFALAIFNNKLIAVGAFDTAGGIVCNNIAEWDDSTWSPLGLGANNTIFAVNTMGSFLIVGGSFTTVGGVNCSRVAKWQDSSWSAIGTGVNGNVYALEEYNNKLIIGGAFTMAGTDTVNRIVSVTLDSSVYSPMGTGIDSGNVFTLETFQGVVYAGGDFRTIAGDTVNRIAFWNDTNWFQVGTGINGTVRTLDSLGGSFMAVGGTFTNANGVGATNIAAYGGSETFVSFGSLSGGTPSVRGVMNWRAIIVGAGSFTSPTGNIARWGLLPLAPDLILPEEAAEGISVTPEFSWTMGNNMYSFTLQVARDANFLNITINDSTLMVPVYQVPPAEPLINLTTYFWKVRAYNGIGNGPYSLIRFFSTGFLGVINNNEIPLRFNLYQNYPNPFNPVTKIKFDLPNIKGDAALKLDIYNVVGEKVTELLNTQYTAGKWELSFDATNLASGIYFYRIQAGDFTQTNKMILLK